MLCEFALTPQVFDDERNGDDPDWKEHLRELGRSMFPRNAASPVVISDLYDGSWRHEFQSTVEAIQDEGAKDLARSFVSMILDATVMRPAIGDWPDGEDSWARQAVSTNAAEPLKRIVVTDSSFPVIAPQGAIAVKLSEIGQQSAWEGIAAGRALPMSIAAQVAALRPMLVHADSVAFISPHVRGQQRDETDFIIEVIRSLARCSWPRPRLLVDLHVEAPDRVGAIDFENRWNNVRANIHGAFHPVRPLVTRIRLFAWEKLLNRYVLGGRVADANGGLVPAGTRWAISTPHVARTGDGADIDHPFWHLLPTNQITLIHSKYYDKPPLRGPIDL